MVGVCDTVSARCCTIISDLFQQISAVDVVVVVIIIKLRWRTHCFLHLINKIEVPHFCQNWATSCNSISIQLQTNIRYRSNLFKYCSDFQKRQMAFCRHIKIVWLYEWVNHHKVCCACAAIWVANRRIWVLVAVPLPSVIFVEAPFGHIWSLWVPIFNWVKVHHTYEITVLNSKKPTS